MMSLFVIHVGAPHTFKTSAIVCETPDTPPVAMRKPSTPSTIAGVIKTEKPKANINAATAAIINPCA